MFATQLQTRLIGIALSLAVTFGILAATNQYAYQRPSSGSDSTVKMEPVIVKAARVA